MMNLQQFVTETFRQVIEGIVEAQKHAQSNGAIVNANLIKYMGDVWNYPEESSFAAPTMIEFDVAVTATDSQDLKGGMGVFVAALGVGYQAEKESIGSQVSRIKFSIPVVLPSQPRIEPPA